MGEIIKSITLYGDKGINLISGEEYLIYAQFIKYEEYVLFGKIIKFKLLNDCYDCS